LKESEATNLATAAEQLENFVSWITPEAKTELQAYLKERENNGEALTP